MVGQAAKAGDMRAGNVPKQGMKAMNGGGGSVSRSSQKYVAPAHEKIKAKATALSHSQLHAQWEANGRDANGKLIKHVEKKEGWSKEEINRARDRAAEERRRAAEVVTVAAADAGEQPEAAPEGEQAHVLARARMRELAEALQSPGVGCAGSSSGEDAGREAQLAAVECRRFQLEELQCLEAMFYHEFMLVGADAVAALRAKCEALGDDAAAADAAALREVVSHPPLECALQLTAHGEREKAAVATAAGEAAADEAATATTPLVASILLRVRFPVDYPNAPPVLSVEDAMVTSQEALGKDKVLATVAMVDEDTLVAAMLEQAAQTLPEQCVFEAVSGVVERAFEFVGPATWV